MTHQQAKDIAASNFNMAIDQAGMYDSIKDAVQSYEENAGDTVMEMGGNQRDADMVFAEYRKLVDAYERKHNVLL